MNDLDDNQLLTRCQSGEEEAWGLLLRRHEGLVLGLARSTGLSDADAEDVCSETMMALLRAGHQLKDGGRLRSWLGTTVVRLSRKKRVAPSELNPETLADPETAPNALKRLEQRAILQESLLELGGECRDLLNQLYGPIAASYQEAAQALDIPLGSIGPSRARCLKKLKAIIDRTRE